MMAALDHRKEPCMTSSSAARPACRLATWLAIWLTTGLAAAMLAGCAANPWQVRVTPGQTEAEMLAAMGTPTARYPMASSTQRVEYATGPSGKVTWMIDLDATGRVKATEQVLTVQNFARVRNGQTSQDLLLMLGQPAERAREGQNSETWSWRYENNNCLWARVTVSGLGHVRGNALIQGDPRCDTP